MTRVFFQKHFSTSVGNNGIYSVSENVVEQIGQNSKTDCFAGILREGLTRETLAKTSYLHPVLTLCIPIMCRAHASLHEKLTRKLPAKPTSVFNFLKSSNSLSLSHITLTNKSHIKYRVHKIEQNYNQIWHGIKANIN